ncbi:MAG TPA: ISAs1 family transposase [Candidatus Sulfotelmatobacter sp.]
MFRHCRLIVGREGSGMGVVTGSGAHSSGTLSKATGHSEGQTRYYITSLAPDAARLNRVVHQHWGIENKLHWALDVSFGEDLNRKRQGHAAQHFSLLTRIALNLLKQDKSSPRGIKGKRLKAGWDHSYLLRVLGI